MEETSYFKKPMLNSMCFENTQIRTFYVNPDDRLSLNSTSKGNQTKWVTEGCYVKADSLGYESVAEVMTSVLLHYIKDMTFAPYYFCFIQEGRQVYEGCYSESFVAKGDNLISLYRILSLVYPSPNKILQSKSSREKLDLILKTVRDVLGVDISTYLQQLFCLDAIILNEDRHLNNICFLNGEPAPIFDNGLSLLADVSEYPLESSIYGLIPKVKAKPLNNNFDIQAKLLPLKPFVLDYSGLKQQLSEYNPPFKKREWKRALEVLWHQLSLEERELWTKS